MFPVGLHGEHIRSEWSRWKRFWLRRGLRWGDGIPEEAVDWKGLSVSWFVRPVRAKLPSGVSLISWTLSEETGTSSKLLFWAIHALIPSSLSTWSLWESMSTPIDSCFSSLVTLATFSTSLEGTCTYLVTVVFVLLEVKAACTAAFRFTSSAECRSNQFFLTTSFSASPFSQSSALAWTSGFGFFTSVQLTIGSTNISSTVETCILHTTYSRARGADLPLAGIALLSFTAGFAGAPKSVLLGAGCSSNFAAGLGPETELTGGPHFQPVCWPTGGSLEPEKTLRSLKWNQSYLIEMTA